MPPPNWLRSGEYEFEELGCAFVLAHLHVAIVGDDSDQPVVTHLMHVIGRRENAWANLRDRLRVVDLVARVAESGEAEFIFDPFSERA